MATSGKLQGVKFLINQKKINSNKLKLQRAKFPIFKAANLRGVNFEENY